jgi:sulfur carrier protein
MEIIINGKAESLNSPCPLSALVIAKGLAERSIGAMVNGEIVRRTVWESHFVSDGDRIELFKFVGGG